jgi:peptidoglycan hydrolase-like protein with peptidoglycan-binding domain
VIEDVLTRTESTVGQETDERTHSSANSLDGARASRLVHRQRIFLWITSGAAVLAIGGLIASTVVKSPAQLAASQGPPPASLLTAQVQDQVLAQQVVARGNVVAGGSITVTPTSEQGADALVLTRAPLAAGSTIKAGQVIAEVSGRPLIALYGRLPAYRDLKPGDSGADISELQSSLESLGYADADASGYFGPGTKTAVKELYEHLGYNPATTDTGYELPRSEFVFIPAFPATLASLNGTLGSTVTAPLATIDTGALVVTATMDQTDGQLLREGMKVQILSESLGQSEAGTLTTIGPYSNGSSPGPGTAGSTAPEPGYPITVTPAGALNTTTWLGENVRLTFTTAASPTKVLAVPVAAITTGADGGTTVTVLGPGNVERRVAVRVGMTANGMCQIIPVTTGSIGVGQSVVTGQ